MSRGIDLNSHSGDPISLSPTNDLYGYNPSIRSLATVVSNCATPLVVGIYGRWGRGKSTFLKSVEAALNANDGTGCYLHHTYSPWQYRLETFDDVWISMVSEFASGKGSIADSLKRLVKEIDWWRVGKKVLGIATKVAGGPDVGSLFDDGESVNEFSQFIDARKKFQDAISDHLEHHPDGRVFIYIDDLDRCEPTTSVNVLRAIQVLCKTKGCVFLMGLDRDVILGNLIHTYKHEAYAKEYLDKIVQLHLELPVLELLNVKAALTLKGDGSQREGISTFVDWVAECMAYNPRKIERFVYLYDYKLEQIPQGQRTGQDFRRTVLFSVWELRWPELSSEVARSRDILDATEELRQAENEEIELGIVKKYDHLELLKRIQADREFLRAFRQFYESSSGV